MALVVIADLKGKGSGFVNKDTIAGGYGSRFKGDSFATRFAGNEVSYETIVRGTAVE